jgi:hypothetical protein
VKSEFMKGSQSLIEGGIQTVHLESGYREIGNQGNRGKPTSKVMKHEISIRERGDQDRWIVGECGPLIWRAKLASSGFRRRETRNLPTT